MHVQRPSTGDAAARAGDLRREGDIVARAADGIFTISSEGSVMTWNAAMERVTGYAADEIIGRKGVGILRARDVEGREVRLDQWAASEAPLPADVRVVTRVDEERWLSFSYSAASAEAGEPLIVIARDITSARELERLREDFVATVSHEMRAPLSPIKGWASTLLQCGDDLKVEERRAALQSILQQAKRLEHLIASLLEVSRIEHGTFEVVEDEVDLDAVVRRVVADFQVASPQRSFRVREGGVRARVKELWLEQVVTNLVENAVKYSPDTGRVEVTVAQEADGIAVAVRDTGCGIPSDELERVFERFHRVRDTATRTGTGLGLSIARQLAGEMGGTITVISVLGRGSTFTLRLPVVSHLVDVGSKPEIIGLEAG